SLRPVTSNAALVSASRSLGEIGVGSLGTSTSVLAFADSGWSLVSIGRCAGDCATFWATFGHQARTSASWASSIGSAAAGAAGAKAAAGAGDEACAGTG